jgi:hypothetical protein
VEPQGLPGDLTRAQARGQFGSDYVDDKTQAEAARALWHMGNLEYLVKDYQLPLYHFMRGDDGLQLTVRVVKISRQWGKSFVGLLACTERCLQKPGASVKVVAKTASSLKQFLLPNMRRLLWKCPEELMPVYNSVDHIYTFKNGSTLALGGAETLRAVDSLRGPAVDLWLIDEASFIPTDELATLIKDVALPTTMTTNGRIILQSSPATRPGHYFTTRCNMAKAKAAYFERSIHDSDATDAQKREWCEEAGGPESDTWRREYENQDILDASTIIIPEYASCKAKLTAKQRPPDAHELLLTAADPGFRDGNGLLFGYYDFQRGVLVIQAEKYVKAVTTADVAREVTATERRLWNAGADNQAPDPRPRREVYRRVCDVDPQFAFDMLKLHRILWQPVRKQALEAMVNQLRIRISTGGLEVDPSCVLLLHQLDTGTWHPSRQAFARSEGMHCDLLAALVYLNLEAPARKNPYPQGSGPSVYTHQSAPSSAVAPTPLTGIAQVMTRAMAPAMRQLLGE